MRGSWGQNDLWGEPGSGGSVLPPGQRGTRATQRPPLSPETSLALTALYYELSHFPHLHAIVSTHRPENVQEWFSNRKRFPYSALRFRMSVHAHSRSLSQSRLTLATPWTVQPTRLLCGGTAKSAGVGCHSLLQASHLRLTSPALAADSFLTTRALPALGPSRGGPQRGRPQRMPCPVLRRLEGRQLMKRQEQGHLRRRLCTHRALRIGRLSGRRTGPPLNRE